MTSEPNPHPAAPKSGRFKTFVAWVCGPIVLLELIALAVVAVWAVQFSSKNNSSEAAYVSTARLLVGGAEANPIPDSFFGTNIEIIQSDHVLRGAGHRVLSLNPNLKREFCRVDVSRLPGTNIIVLRARGADPAWLEAYLDAIMDEFLATRRELESKMGTQVFSLNDALVRLEKEIPLEEQQIKASEQSGASPETLIKQKASLQQVKMAYDRLLATLRQLDVHRADGAPSITILEHASRDSASPGMVLDPPPSIYDRYIKRFINLFR